MPAGEFAAIARFERLFGPSPQGEVGIGDDAAVVSPPSGHLLLAADAIVEGVHFDLALVGLADVGWKSVVVNVSDIAAMGGTPLHALVTVAGPSSTDLDMLYAGIAEAAEHYGCRVVGGDLVNSPLLVITVALTGTLDGQPVLRSGARPGDAIYVSGPLGASTAALRALRSGANANADADGGAVSAYRRPRARATEGVALGRSGVVTSMIDVSDGLVADLSHIADASGVGIALDDVPLAAGATLEDALGGGEDFELAFTAPPSAAGDIGIDNAIRIGTCTRDPGQRSLGGAPLPVVGWEHQWGGSKAT